MASFSTCTVANNHIEVDVVTSCLSTERVKAVVSFNEPFSSMDLELHDILIGDCGLEDLQKLVTLNYA